MNTNIAAAAEDEFANIRELIGKTLWYEWTATVQEGSAPSVPTALLADYQNDQWVRAQHFEYIDDSGIFTVDPSDSVPVPKPVIHGTFALKFQLLTGWQGKSCTLGEFIVNYNKLIRTLSNEKYDDGVRCLAADCEYARSATGFCSVHSRQGLNRAECARIHTAELHAEIRSTLEKMQAFIRSPIPSIPIDEIFPDYTIIFKYAGLENPRTKLPRLRLKKLV